MLKVNDLPLESRPRERLMFDGARALNTVELVQIILGSTPGYPVYEVAAQLLSTFKGLEGIDRAEISELTDLAGIGPAKAAELKAALELGRRLIRTTVSDRMRIVTPADAANLLMPELQGQEQEHLVVVILNTRNEVISMRTLYIGSLNAATVRVGEVFRDAIRQNGAAIIVGHNHPSQDPSPSREDVRVTRELAKAGKLLNIDLLDHLIIGRDRFVSLKERGLGFDDV